MCHLCDVVNYQCLQWLIDLLLSFSYSITQVWYSNPSLRDWLKENADKSQLDKLKWMYYVINKSPWYVPLMKSYAPFSILLPLCVFVSLFASGEYVCLNRVQVNAITLLVESLYVNKSKKMGIFRVTFLLGKCFIK